MSLTKESLMARMNITEEQGEALVAAALENPLNAMTLLTDYKVPPEALQELAGEFMMNPGIFINLAREMNIPEDKIEDFKSKFGL